MIARTIFHTTIAAASLVAAVAAVAAVAVAAATHTVTYTSTANFGGPLPLSAASLVVTTAAGTHSVGGHDITGVIGAVDGDTVTGLIPLDGPLGSSHCVCFPDGYGAANFNFSVSNTFYDAGPSFDHGGVGFASATTWYNLWIEDGHFLLASIPVGTAEILNGDYSAVSVSLGTGSVPEPASWALLIVGFMVTGAVLRRRAMVSVAA